MEVDQRIRIAQNKIVARFTEMDDPLFTYELLLDSARRFRPLNEDDRRDEYKVRGCQSQAWLKLSCEGGAFHMEADSDTLVVKGIIALLAEAFEGRQCSDVAQAPVSFLQEARVMDTFDASRRSGIEKIVERIQAFARVC